MAFSDADIKSDQHPKHERATSRINRSRSRRGRYLRWRKAIRDLAYDRLRTLLVILSIGIGVTVFGMIMITILVIEEFANSNYAGINPASGILITQSGFEEDLTESIARLPEVALVASRRSATVRVKKADGDWADLQLLLLSNADDMQQVPIDIVVLHEVE